MASHPIVHIEFAATDPRAASRFYSDLLGWQIQTDPTFDYHMFSADGGPGGGFVGVDGERYQPGSVLVYVGTDDIEGTLAQAEALGGQTLVPKTEIPGMGWFAVLADPTGNRLGLFTGQPAAN